jgi:CAAX prenyl protease-like protein
MSENSETAARDDGAMSILPYVAPIFAYIALGGVESYLPQVEGQPDPNWYFAAYAMKFLIVGFLAWWFRSTWQDLRPSPNLSSLWLAAFIGLVVWILWVGLDGIYPMLPFQGKRVGFDPYRLSLGFRWIFIAVRMAGLALLVPMIEELFWRSFLIRWLIDPEFRRVPVGRVTPIAAVVSSVFFALVHPEWLPALLTGLLWAWLLWWTRSLLACVVSHAVANLALGIYVIATHEWKFW